MKACEAQPQLRLYFDHYAGIYGYQKCRGTAAEGKLLATAADWVEQLGIAPKEFIELQLNGVDASVRENITLNSLFKNKDVCLARLPVSAIAIRTSYENCVAYHSQLVIRFARAEKMYVPSLYPTRDYLLLDFTRPYPAWFRLLELSNINTEDIRKYSARCNVMFKQALHDCASEPGLAKLLKEKYGTDTDNRYEQRIARWL